jgi:hypothetical protein
MATRFDLPDVLTRWIQSHIPDLENLSTVRFRSCTRIPFWWIPGNRNMSGLTLGNRVYVRSQHCPINPRNEETVNLIFHELIHVVQFRKNPFLFPFRYIRDHLTHGYAGNPAEIEARRWAAHLTQQFFDGNR